jgi:hypothetical protein
MTTCNVCLIDRDNTLFIKHNKTCLICRRKKWSQRKIRETFKKYGLKVCTKCGEVKLISEFALAKDKGDGLSSHCKSCNRIWYTEEYYINNKDDILAKNAKWQLDNPELHLEHGRAWYSRLDKPSIDLKVEYNKEYRHNNSDKVKVWNARKKSKRKGFGYEPLNEQFDGAEFHHLHLDDNHNIGIWIPADLHKSVWHSSSTWQGMDEINKLAFEFLNGEIK